jgi:hypothetical protein
MRIAGPFFDMGENDGQSKQLSAYFFRHAQIQLRMRGRSERPLLVSCLS